MNDLYWSRITRKEYMELSEDELNSVLKCRNELWNILSEHIEDEG